MENRNEREGFDNNLFMKEKRDDSVREDRNTQEREQNSEFRARRSYNPNFNAENRLSSSRPRTSTYQSRERDGYNRYEKGGESRPYTRREEGGDTNSYQRRENSDRRPFSRHENGERRPYQRREDDGERRPYQRRENSDFERRPYPQREYNNKPYSRRDDDATQKPYSRRENGNSDFNRREGGYERRDNQKSYERRPYQRREDDGERYPRRDEMGRRPRVAQTPVRDRAKAPVKKFNKDKAPYFAEPLLNKEIRLNRYIAMSGICSRRDADEIITKGEIAINDVVVTELGTKVMPNDVVTYQGNVIRGEKLAYIVMNKPRGVVTTLDDPHAEQTVIDLLNDKVSERVFPVGRLDKNSLGVILLTNDGDLAKELSHPSYEKKKLYHVFVDKDVNEEDMEKLAEGIELEDGFAYADEVSYVKNNMQEIGIEIHSGRNRIVRRMFEHLGYKVSKLDRVYFAGLTKKNLKRGMWRYLTEREVIALKSGSYK